MRYSDKTKYPKIYKSSYWGNFKAEADRPEKEVIQNRNAFIEVHQIVAYKRLTLSQYDKYKTEADHQETYEDKQGRIIQVFSEYPRKEYTMFKPMRPIYATGQVSGYRKIEGTRKSKNILMKQVFKKVPDDIVKYIQTYLKR